MNESVIEWGRDSRNQTKVLRFKKLLFRQPWSTARYSIRKFFASRLKHLSSQAYGVRHTESLGQISSADILNQKQESWIER
jgi:hypothetical protein